MNHHDCGFLRWAYTSEACQSAMEGALPHTAELLATDRFWEERSHCLLLCAHQRVHQTNVDSSKTTVTQTARVKLGG